MYRIVLATLLVVMAVPALAQDAAPRAPRVDLYLGVGNTRTVSGGHASDYHSTGPVVKCGSNLSRRVGLVNVEYLSHSADSRKSRQVEEISSRRAR
jgi:hypothetical protein